MEESWKAIPGYVGAYEVSSFGAVRSVDRTTVSEKDGRTRVYPGKLLKQCTKNRRYATVSLSVNGALRSIKVARLVALAFVDNPNGKPEVNHKDGDRLNNRAENLEWATRKENMRHAVETGLRPPKLGEKHGCARLKESEVLKIRELREQGAELRQLGEEFGVHHSTIFHIVHRMTWTHI